MITYFQAYKNPIYKRYFNLEIMKLGALPLVLVVLIIQLVSLHEAKAQDPRFSQFYTAPSQLNPAMTGVFEGRWRFHANYRDQWSSILKANPFKTIAAGFDMRYRIVGEDYLGIGINAMHDEAGTSHFTTDRAYLSAAYMKQVGGGRYRTDDQYLIAGGSLGFGQQSIDNRVWFSSQYNVTAGRPDTETFASGESFDGEEVLRTDVYLDVNVGLMYYALFGDNTSIYLGGAMNHLTVPDISLTGNSNEELYRRWIAHAGGEIPFSTELSILPAVQVMGQGPSLEGTLGANFRYTNRDWRELAIRAGLWTRLVNTIDGQQVDALIVTTILEVERWNLGLSYDMTTSQLNLANNSRGAFELSMIYTHPAKSRIKVNCPKF